MPDNAPAFLDNVMIFATVAGAWLTGEVGRIVVASGAGGLARWLASERKTILTGFLSVAGGVLVGSYLWPMVLQFISMLPGVQPEASDAKAMAGFIAGMMGISGAKIVLAVIEARGRRASGGENGKDEPR